jgi:hypothetical protein
MLGSGAIAMRAMLAAATFVAFLAGLANSLSTPIPDSRQCPALVDQCCDRDDGASGELDLPFDPPPAVALAPKLPPRLGAQLQYLAPRHHQLVATPPRVAALHLAPKTSPPLS